jgi:hypothetical protein
MPAENPTPEHELANAIKLEREPRENKKNALNPSPLPLCYPYKDCRRGSKLFSAKMRLIEHLMAIHHHQLEVVYRLSGIIARNPRKPTLEYVNPLSSVHCTCDTGYEISGKRENIHIIDENGQSILALNKIMEPSRCKPNLTSNPLLPVVPQTLYLSLLITVSSMLRLVI